MPNGINGLSENTPNFDSSEHAAKDGLDLNLSNEVDEGIKKKLTSICTALSGKSFGVEANTELLNILARHLKEIKINSPEDTRKIIGAITGDPDRFDPAVIELAVKILTPLLPETTTEKLQALGIKPLDDESNESKLENPQPKYDGPLTQKPLKDLQYSVAQIADYSAELKKPSQFDLGNEKKVSKSKKLFARLKNKITNRLAAVKTSNLKNLREKLNSVNRTEKRELDLEGVVIKLKNAMRTAVGVKGEKAIVERNHLIQSLASETAKQLKMERGGKEANSVHVEAKRLLRLVAAAYPTTFGE